MGAHWYTLLSRLNKEGALWYEACAFGLDVFYPRTKIRPVNPRACKVRPYFPGFMFVHTDLFQLRQSIFAWLSYSQGLVSFGGDPSYLTDGLIEVIYMDRNKISAGMIQSREAEVFRDGLFYRVRGDLRRQLVWKRTGPKVTTNTWPPAVEAGIVVETNRTAKIGARRRPVSRQPDGYFTRRSAYVSSEISEGQSMAAILIVPGFLQKGCQSL